MTISSTTVVTRTATNGSTHTFNFGHPFGDPDDLTVYLVTTADWSIDLQVRDTDYTVSDTGEEEENGGSITFIDGLGAPSAPASGKSVVILREPDLIQDFNPSGRYPAEQGEDALDRIYQLLQLLEWRSDRSIRLNDAYADNDVILPDVATRADMALGFDENGDIEMTARAVDILEDNEAALAAAEAAASAAATSASAAANSASAASASAVNAATAETNAETAETNAETAQAAAEAAQAAAEAAAAAAAATDIGAHLADTTDAHDASAISFSPAGTIAATDVQAAIDEVSGDISTVATDLWNHIGDSSDAHDASAISIADAGANYTATDVEAALAEVFDALEAHIADDTAVHAGSAVSFTPAGNIAATDVQAAIEELDSEKQPLDATLTDLAALGDAGADAGLFWDDSEGFIDYWTPSGALSFSGTNLVVAAAAEGNAGAVELATAAETTTGTDTARAVTPDGLAGSDFGKTVLSVLVFDDDTDVSTGDGAGNIFWRVPAVLNGYNLVAVAAAVQTAGTTNTTDVQIHNVTQAADMLSTKITIDSGETDSSTAASAAVIDTNNDDVATGDRIRIDVDAVSTTAPKGLLVELTFQLP
jgi:multidrug efflux pump subunit AcrA (membrane-fusion protein)